MIGIIVYFMIGLGWELFTIILVNVLIRLGVLDEKETLVGIDWKLRLLIRGISMVFWTLELVILIYGCIPHKESTLDVYIDVGLDEIKRMDEEDKAQ